MDARILAPGSSARDIAKFGCLFYGCTVVFFLLFDRYQDIVVLVYVQPLSEAASFLLHGIGIRSGVTANMQAGACALSLGPVSYWITQGCTGLFTCTLYISGILSYPVAMQKKLIGLLIGIPAFFSFGILRVVIMAIVAVTEPARIETFHVYIMAIANLGFAMFVWIYWFNRIVKRDQSGPIPG